jgi:transcriptional regulator with XRE-family HTH domain
MSKTQENFTRLLSSKSHIKGVDKYTVNRWKNGKSSPSIETMDKICFLNDLEPPFFHDGTIDNLMDFTKKSLSKLGLKGQLIFEDLKL